MTAAKLLVMGGRLAMVHRPNRLTDILLGMKEYGLEPKNIRLVYPNLKKSPNMVLIEAVLGGRPYLSWMPPLIVFKDNGEFTDELKAIYYESLN